QSDKMATPPVPGAVPGPSRRRQPGAGGLTPATGQETAMNGLDGKVALITGGARGMGASHAGHLTAQGARVVLGDVRDEIGEAVAADLGPACRYVHHDVTSEADWVAAGGATLTPVGPVGGLINQARVLPRRPIGHMSPAGVHQ